MGCEDCRNQKEVLEELNTVQPKLDLSKLGSHIRKATLKEAAEQGCEGSILYINDAADGKNLG